ncbi:MAG: hypothetical protein EOM67_06715 [Spirochaetia bacterium]|nr:hypothetical protein [Spirochaetia bacterium]
MKPRDYKSLYMEGNHIKEERFGEMMEALDKDFHEMLLKVLNNRTTMSHKNFNFVVTGMKQKWEAIFSEQRSKGKTLWDRFYRFNILPYKVKYTDGVCFKETHVEEEVSEQEVPKKRFNLLELFRGKK